MATADGVANAVSRPASLPWFRRPRKQNLGGACRDAGCYPCRPRHRTLSSNFTSHANTVDDAQVSDHDGRMYEAYAAWQFDPPSTAELGKPASHWGKVYAWNPVAFFERLNRLLKYG